MCASNPLFLSTSFRWTKQSLRQLSAGLVAQLMLVIVRSYTREDAQMELAYALTPFLENSENLIGPEAPLKVLGAPGLIPRLVEMASCCHREGEVQRLALQCLVLTAELSPQVAHLVLRAGAKEVAEKAVKQPFAGPKNVSEVEQASTSDLKNYRSLLSAVDTCLHVCDWLAYVVLTLNRMWLMMAASVLIIGYALTLLLSPLFAGRRPAIDAASGYVIEDSERGRGRDAGGTSKSTGFKLRFILLNILPR